MRRLLSLIFLSFILAGAEPWTDKDLVKTQDAAKDLNGPLILHVGFAAFYHAAHITRSEYAGPGSKSEGLDALKKAVEGQPRSREIILYCGCCPWDKCPNIRPAFALLHQIGYTNVKVMTIPASLKTDWIDKGYPTDKQTDIP
jgi:hypothetical protein